VKKRIYFLLLGVFMCATAVNAQRISLGPVLGVNLMQNQDVDIDQNFQVGWFGGTGFEYHFSPKVSLVSGLFVSQKFKLYEYEDEGDLTDFLPFPVDIGALIGFDVNTTSYSKVQATVKSTYLEMPLMASYNVSNFSIQAGPYFGLLISSNTMEHRTTTIPLLQAVDIDAFDPTGGFLSQLLPPAEDESEWLRDSKDELVRFDIGGNVAMAYAHERFRFKVSYSFGFTGYRVDEGVEQEEEEEMEEEEEGEFFIENSSYQVLRISVGYLIRFGKKKKEVPSIEPGS
jgi:hypothetical protein